VVKSLLATGLVVSAVVGAGYIGLRSLGEEAKATFDELNRALEPPAPGKGKASAQDVAEWIERYRLGVRRAECPREGVKGWDYVCVFVDGDGRRKKVGVMVGPIQPTQTSPPVGAGQRLPPPST
jgi:hypothetical protein